MTIFTFTGELVSWKRVLWTSHLAKRVSLLDSRIA